MSAKQNPEGTKRNKNDEIKNRGDKYNPEENREGKAKNSPKTRRQTRSWKRYSREKIEPPD